MPSRSWTVTAEPVAVRTLRREVARFACEVGVDPRRVDDLRLAVTEAVSNAVRHAYAGRDDAGPVGVRAEAGARTFTVAVVDEGGGLRPRPDSPGLGLGLPLMSRLADSLEFLERPGGGTEVRLGFPRAA
jgi:anti-sigma regulatory factor (Ser/Thr protein kinase)